MACSLMNPLPVWKYTQHAAPLGGLGLAMVGRQRQQNAGEQHRTIYGWSRRRPMSVLLSVKWIGRHRVVGSEQRKRVRTLCVPWTSCQLTPERSLPSRSLLLRRRTDRRRRTLDRAPRVRIAWRPAVRNSTRQGRHRRSRLRCNASCGRIPLGPHRSDNLYAARPTPPKSTSSQLSALDSYTVPRAAVSSLPSVLLPFAPVTFRNIPVMG